MRALLGGWVVVVVGLRLREGDQLDLGVDLMDVRHACEYGLGCGRVGG